MSQRYQPQSRGVQQSQGVGTQTQQRTQAQSGQQQQFEPVHFDEALPSEYRATLEDLSWLRKQTKWASERAHVKFQGTGIETTLEDISEIAELNEELILSNSKFVQHEIDTFRRVATQAIQELQQYQQEPFVQAVVSDLSRAIHSADELLASPEATQQVGTQSQVQGGTAGMQRQQSQFPQQGQSQTQPRTQSQSQPFGQSQY